jgi:hypothetical protein
VKPPIDVQLSCDVILEEGKERSLIEKAIRQRIEGVKLRKPDLIREVVDAEFYSKFDDWPPGLRLKGEEALESEEAALNVLDEYQYNVFDLEVRVNGETAWASFILHYDGMIRKRSFKVESRVSMVLTKSEPEHQWKIVHEHFSIRPLKVPTLAPRRLAKEVKAREAEKDKVVKEAKGELEEEIVKVLGDGVERSTAEIIREISKSMGGDVASSKVVESCQRLVSKGVIESRGRFYPKYRIKQ